MGIPARAIERDVKAAHKRLRLRAQDLKESQRISKEFSLSEVAARVLAARGYKADERLRHFLKPTLKEGLPDPKDLKNLDRACDLIAAVVEKGGAIAVCCDFDVDGLSGGAQVHHFLKAIGVRTKVFVPDRFTEGYGLNEGMIRSAVEEKFALLITVDYGTTNVKELTLARELGLPTIVIDHHHVTTPPPCDVFINPNQSGCGFAEKILSASALAWYLIVGLRGKLAPAKAIEARSYLDLACLGTICDMVPLIGANRVIAKKGLELLCKTTRPGLVALKNVIGINGEVSCSDVGFGVGPRLNAAGRMVHGDVVIDLLTSDDTSLVKKVAQRLHRLNAERQEAEAMVKAAAIELVKKIGHLPYGVVVWHPEFHTGVVGIVAQRLVETFYRPAAVMGMDSDGAFKGSVRGIRGFSVVETLHAVGHLLIKFGGHEGAGGFSVHVDKVEEFARAFDEECERRLQNIETEPFSDADTEVELADIDLDLIAELEGLAPFGMGNPAPQLMIKNLKVCDVKQIKSVHTKTTLTDGSRYITGMMWRQIDHPALLSGSKVNIVCRADVSNFNGETEVQAILQAVEKA